ncbi:pentatricopeptide repeat-containing protein [Forsythia ovata]|uniref:Pentatricopeptide repeat-containing protein n=1 Tax=Forsythia ovata TaxID=205694 RepID=A0ABD1VGW9_9LAMI
MKFWKILCNQINETLPDWQDKFLSYKDLKKLLKLIYPKQGSCKDLENSDINTNGRPNKRPRLSAEEKDVGDCVCGGGDEGEEVTKEVIDFLELSEKEIDKFNGFFVDKEELYINSTRFFSSNSSEDYEKEIAESSVLEANEGSNEVSGSADNVFDGSMSSISSEFEAGSSIFNDGLAAEIDDDSVRLDEKFNSFATEDENIEKMEEIDIEKVQSFLSLLQSSGTADRSLDEDFEKMGLILNEDFVVMVLETLYVPGESLIGFFRWVLKKSEFKVTMGWLSSNSTTIAMVASTTIMVMVVEQLDNSTTMVIVQLSRQRCSLVRLLAFDDWTTGLVSQAASLQ